MKPRAKLAQILEYSLEKEQNLLQLQQDYQHVAENAEFKKFRSWFLGQFEVETYDSLMEFSLYFMDAVQEQAGVHLNTTTNTNTSTFEQNFSTLSLTSTPTLHAKRKSTAHNVTAPAPSATASNKRANRSAMTLADFLATKPQQAKNASSIKRVQPLTVSCSTAGPRRRSLFGSSAFSNDNNIIELEQHGLMRQADRQSLKQDVQEMSKLIKQTHEDEVQVRTVLTANVNKCELPNLANYESLIKNIKHKLKIQILCAIYVVLLDLNYVQNVLQQIAFLYNLINSTTPTASGSSNTTTNDCSLLQHFEHSIYFALLCLSEQHALFTHFDAKTLNTLVASVRLQQLATNLHAHLCRVHDSKQQLMCAAQRQTLQLQSTVYMQQTEESRQNFANMTAFHAYKMQRDTFYEILHLWEAQHLRPDWNLQQEAAHKIHELFRRCEHPSNMLQFAKLFVSQLLLSYNYSCMTPSEVGLDINVQKFHLLSKRLVTAEHFNMDYDFPGHQLFFCEFLLATRSIAFMQQLKMHLYARLMELNDCISEQFNVYAVAVGTLDTLASEHSSQGREYVVRAEILQSMLILGKFLGYVLQLPYAQAQQLQDLPIHLAQQQQKLRSQLPPLVDMPQLLKKALLQHKLMITLPWLTQYMAMLDETDMSLPASRQTLHLLYALLTAQHAHSLLTPCSYFVLRCCLCWLGQRKQLVADAYMQFKCLPQREQLSVELSQLAAAKQSAQCDFKSAQQVMLPCAGMQLASILEDVIRVACPALSQFRAEIVRSSQAFRSKSQSRSGRYRHITTRYTTTSSQEHKETDINKLQDEHVLVMSKQQRLRQAFLEQQSGATRRLLDFLIEHLTRLAEHEVQQQLFASVQAAAEQAEQLEYADKEELQAKLENLYENLRLKALTNYEQTVRDYLQTRIKLALKALMPPETVAEFHDIFYNFIMDTCQQHMQEYREVHLNSTSYMSNYVKGTVQRIIKRNLDISLVGETTLGQEDVADSPTDSTELDLRATNCDVSPVLQALHRWLHVTSMNQPFLESNTAKLEEFLQQRIMPVFIHKLPTQFYTILAYNLVLLLQQIILVAPKLVSPSMLQAVCNILKSKDMKENNDNFTAPTECPLSSEESDCQSDNEEEKQSLLIINNQVQSYDNLISFSFVRQLDCSAERFDKYFEVLSHFVDANIITIKFITERFTSLFKEDMESEKLKLISDLLRRLATTYATVGKEADGGSDDEKDALFLELLADISMDKDFI